MKRGTGLCSTGLESDVQSRPPLMSHPKVENGPSSTKSHWNYSKYQMSFRVTNINTFLFLLIFIVAFFPNAFIYLLNLPLRIFLPPHAVTPPNTSIPSHPCCAFTNSAAFPPPTMSWFQKTFTLPSKSRGSYLVTDHIEQQLPELKQYKVGLLNLFLQHTSAALSLNENYDEDVREDMSDALDRIAPEDRKGNMYRHSAEGLDDMPVSARVLGESQQAPCQSNNNGCRHTSKVLLLERRSLCQSGMENWQQAHGRECGILVSVEDKARGHCDLTFTKNSDRASIRGKWWQRFKARRRSREASRESCKLRYVFAIK